MAPCGLHQSIGRRIGAGPYTDVARERAGRVGVVPCMRATNAGSMPTSKSIQHAATWRRSWRGPVTGATLMVLAAVALERRDPV